MTVDKSRYGTLPQKRARKKKRITEDDPRWDARTMGDRTGWYKGQYYVNGKRSGIGRGATPPKTF